MINILGLTLGAGFGAVLLVLGILALFKGSVGQSIKGFLGMIPIGSPKLWAVLFIVAGLALGGLAYSISGVQGLFSGASTGSIIGTPTPASTVTPIKLSNIVMNTPTGTTYQTTTAPNVSFVQDTGDLTHYTIALNSTALSSASLNGTITMERTGDLSKSASMNCQFVCGTFRSQTSTTDVSTYFMCATSATKSKIAGVAWQETAYLSDGSIATTASLREITPVIFTGGDAAAPTVSKTLGYYFTLPSSTILNYLNDNSAIDNYIKCDTDNDGNFETTVARLTILKQTV